MRPMTYYSIYRTYLRCEQLEQRDTPSIVVTAAEAGWHDFVGTVVRADGDLNGDIALDGVYVGQSGAGNRVTIKFESAQYESLKDANGNIVREAGVPVMVRPTWTENLMAFPDTSSVDRYGLEAVIVDRVRPDSEMRSIREPGILVVSYHQPGTGPVIWTYDYKTKESETRILDGIPIDFRGGVHSESVSVRERVQDFYSADSHAIFTARRGLDGVGGGAPLMWVYGIDPVTDRLTLQRTLVLGDINSRDGVYLHPTLTGIQMPGQGTKLGFYTQIEGGIEGYLWDGTFVERVLDPVSGTAPEWGGSGRLPNLRTPDSKWLVDQLDYLDRKELYPDITWEPGDSIFAGVG